MKQLLLLPRKSTKGIFQPGFNVQSNLSGAISHIERLLVIGEFMIVSLFPMMPSVDMSVAVITHHDLCRENGIVNSKMIENSRTSVVRKKPLTRAVEFQSRVAVDENNAARVSFGMQYCRWRHLSDQDNCDMFPPPFTKLPVNFLPEKLAALLCFCINFGLRESSVRFVRMSLF